MSMYCSGKFGMAVVLLHRSCQQGIASKSQLVRHASTKNASYNRKQNFLLTLHIEPHTHGMRYFSQAYAMRTFGQNGCRSLLMPVCQPAVWKRQPSRGVAMFVVRVVRSVMKLRYLVLGGSVAGGYTLNQTYEKWKQSLPDVKWLEEYMPNPDKLNGFRNSLIGFSETVLNNIQNLEIDPRLKNISEAKMQEMKQWFNARLESAIQAAEIDMNNNTASVPQGVQVLTQLIDTAREGKSQWFASQLKEGTRGFPSAIHAVAYTERRTEYNKYEESSQQRLEAMQAELMEIQSKYQKEVERLEKENKELRRQTLLRGKAVESKRVKKSLIELYSEVLDELSGYDSSYQTADHLPRIVVVGDQSSGKTSVLEMIAQARIFPRGAGEMMTRAPVKVTLSEGPYHIAEFKDGNREYDLTKESDLADLRKEVERRMKNSVMIGETVSSDVISMSVKGPGLQRMVLVDLPGIISTVTTEMAEGTREAIKQMTETYMANPNAIILCIQDGSVDAERSNVTDLVAKMDPQGRRTIFVLTKVDLAEENLANPERVKKILEGKLFPMKALGYFGVVTGRGRSDESIESIRAYEQQFFKKSKLMKDGKIMSSQVTTRNLTLAVAECFWKMVRDTVEQQADAFKATRFNLETEWKNTFPRLRELDRDELFEKARGEILDEVASLSQVSAHDWEKAFREAMWDKMRPYVFENIYMAAAQARNPASFITSVDIKLKHLVENKLAHDAVECGWEVLQAQFKRLMDAAKKAKNHDDIFDNLKDKVISEAVERHKWEDKAFNMLKASQLNVLEDRTITDKAQWAEAVSMLEDTLRANVKSADEMVREAVGPGKMEQWTKWRSSTKDQKKRNAVKNELDAILNSDLKHSSILAEDETVTVKKNLQRKGLNVDDEYIRDTWHMVYRRNFLNQSLMRAVECRKGFFLYSQGMDHEMECADVLMFWKLNQIMKVTTTALRQQVMNREARRLEKEVKEVLEEFSQSREMKQKLLTGRRVTLAEELKRVRLIQEKLEDFIHRLNEK